MPIDDVDKQQLGIAVGVVVLSVVAIAAFVFTGAGWLFYILAVITILLGFYMAYTLHKEGAPAAVGQRQPKPKRRR